MGGTDCGYSVQTRSGSTVYSELAHQHHTTLGNKAYCNPVTSTATNCVVQAGCNVLNVGPFSHLEANAYGSGLESTLSPAVAWGFNFDGGRQATVKKGSMLLAVAVAVAVAVRPGDVTATAPEPQTLVLTLTALGAAMLARRRRPH